MREIISVGECMVELARRRDNAFDLRVGGDTFNTAIYLARLGTPVTYMTAVGDDPYSAEIISAAAAEAIRYDTIQIVPERMPGLYLIETDDGERSFWYWRDTSPARELFELDGADELLARLANAEIVYLTGVTLSLYSERGLWLLETALTKTRENGGRVILDSNFRPIGWRRDIARAQAVFERFWRICDIALPSFDDEQALWGDLEPAQTFARLASFGVPEMCLKLANRGAIVTADGEMTTIPPVSVPKVIDSTAAGDSFSAAYVSARMNGVAPPQAAVYGNTLASIVIQHPGAIAPASATNQFGDLVIANCA
jgi:2-dehydro-3-deoxygluconokinase